MRIWKRYGNPATTAGRNKSEQGATGTTRGADSTAWDTKTKNLGGLTVDAQRTSERKGIPAHVVYPTLGIESVILSPDDDWILKPKLFRVNKNARSIAPDSGKLLFRHRDSTLRRRLLISSGRRRGRARGASGVCRRCFALPGVHHRLTTAAIGFGRCARRGSVLAVTAAAGVS